MSRLIHAELEDFLTDYALLVFHDEDTLASLDFAGVDFGIISDSRHSMKGALAHEAITKYRDLRKVLDHRQAKEALTNEISLLDYHAKSLTLGDRPKDPAVIAYRYKSLKQAQGGLDLATAIAKKPNEVETILGEFMALKAGESVRAYEGAELAAIFDMAQSIRKSQGPHVVIPRFPLVSELIGGFNPGRITLLLSASGMGKTNLAMNLAEGGTDVGPVLYFNLEMADTDIATRVYATRSGEAWRDVLAGDLKSYNTPSFNNPLIVTNGEELSLLQIASAIDHFKRKYLNLFFVVVDYDQKLDLEITRDTPEWKAIQNAVKTLERLSMKHDLHVLLIAQINREGQISSSHRAQYTAHSVLTFEYEDERPWIHNKLKARHAPTPRAVWLDYSGKRGRIEEANEGLIDMSTRTPVKPTSYRKIDSKRSTSLPYKD